MKLHIIVGNQEEDFTPEQEEQKGAAEGFAEAVRKVQNQAENNWGWCCATVTAQLRSDDGETIDEETEYLGCCSYYSVNDFVQNSGYFKQMSEEALNNLSKRHPFLLQGNKILGEDVKPNDEEVYEKFSKDQSMVGKKVIYINQNIQKVETGTLVRHDLISRAKVPMPVIEFNGKEFLCFGLVLPHTVALENTLRSMNQNEAFAFCNYLIQGLASIKKGR